MGDRRRRSQFGSPSEFPQSPCLATLPFWPYAANHFAPESVLPETREIRKNRYIAGLSISDYNNRRQGRAYAARRTRGQH